MVLEQHKAAIGIFTLEEVGLEDQKSPSLIIKLTFANGEGLPFEWEFESFISAKLYWRDRVLQYPKP